MFNDQNASNGHTELEVGAIIKLFRTTVFMVNWRYESYWKIQNFSSISLKLCLLTLGQKNRDMGCEYHFSL